MFEVHYTFIIMKKIILASLVFLSFKFIAQEKQIELNCYNKWSIKFEERGAEEVKDGLYNDVIITNRQGVNAVCNNGKAEVRKGKLVNFHILLDDGNYEEVKRTWKNNPIVNFEIKNGISANMVSNHNEIINVLWPKNIKPKKAKASEASDPTDE